MYTNARDELLTHLGERTLRSSMIGRFMSGGLVSTHSLPADYTKKQYKSFLASLNFKYKKGAHYPELVGYAVVDDSTVAVFDRDSVGADGWVWR